MENFNVNTFTFFSNPRKHILDTLASHNYFENPVAEELSRFFRETNADYIPQQPVQSSREYFAFERICEYLYLPYYDSWYCHMSAPFFALMHEDQFNFYFGFTQGLHGDAGRKNMVMMHSFVMSHTGELYDPHLEAVIRQHQHCTLHDFGWYFGVKIPNNVAFSIFTSLPENEGVQNFWGYLLKNIFVCKKRTDWFIDVVNKNGQGWKLI
jgi:hypothetical protein